MVKKGGLHRLRCRIIECNQGGIPKILPQAVPLPHLGERPEAWEGSRRGSPGEGAPELPRSSIRSNRGSESAKLRQDALVSRALFLARDLGPFLVDAA